MSANPGGYVTHVALIYKTQVHVEEIMPIFIKGNINQGDDCFDLESCPDVSSVPLIVYKGL